MPRSIFTWPLNYQAWERLPPLLCLITIRFAFPAQMPHYHGEEATRAIKPILGDYYTVDNREVWPTVPPLLLRRYHAAWSWCWTCTVPIMDF